MEYIRKTTEIAIAEPTVLSLGKFDGLHMGHKLLVEHVLKKKKEEGLAAVMFTFDIPPKSLVCQELSGVLTAGEERETVFAKTGIDYLIEYPFTEEVRGMEPEAFVKLLVEKLHVKCMVAGRDFRFGRDRSGDYRTLQKLGPKYGFEVIIVKKREYESREISSTFIREEIQKGNLKKANLLLGYEYFVQGTVVHGRDMGKKILGIPTVNLLPPSEKLLPPFGVYISRVELEDGRVLGSISNIGRKPTIAGENPVGIETHIFDFEEDLYGREVRIRFLDFLRSEKKFASLEALKEQMMWDIGRGKAYLQAYKRRKL